MFPKLSVFTLMASLVVALFFLILGRLSLSGISVYNVIYVHLLQFVLLSFLFLDSYGLG